MGYIPRANKTTKKSWALFCRFIINSNNNIIILKVFYVYHKIKPISKYINPIWNQDFLCKRKYLNIKLTKMKLRQRTWNVTFEWIILILFPPFLFMERSWKQENQEQWDVQILISKTSSHQKEWDLSGEMTNFRSEERKASSNSGHIIIPRSRDFLKPSEVMSKRCRSRLEGTPLPKFWTTKRQKE